MTLFAWPDSTRGQVGMAVVHVGMLGVALGLAWWREGPMAERAFWAILAYFVEIAVVGIFEILLGMVRAGEAGSSRAED